MIPLSLLILVLPFRPIEISIARDYGGTLSRSQNTEAVVWKASYDKLMPRLDSDTLEAAIVVSIAEQKLFLIEKGRAVETYPVSTSKYGIGNTSGSNKTPLGTHRICAKIGDGEPVGMTFDSRKRTGRIAKICTDEIDLEQDDITTRILRLEGLEEGVNKGEGIDSFARYIYIHGTPEEGLIGSAQSHGCVRMKNQDVIDLFDSVSVGTLVEIQE